jgi:hypothetical protein
VFQTPPRRSERVFLTTPMTSTRSRITSLPTPPVTALRRTVGEDKARLNEFEQQLARMRTESEEWKRKYEELIAERVQNDENENWRNYMDFEIAPDPEPVEETLQESVGQQGSPEIQVQESLQVEESQDIFNFDHPVESQALDTLTASGSIYRANHY